MKSFLAVLVALFLVALPAFRGEPNVQAQAQKRQESDWERVDNYTTRLLVPGGWLVARYGALCFLPDTKHEWVTK